MFRFALLAVLGLALLIGDSDARFRKGRKHKLRKGKGAVACAVQAPKAAAPRVQAVPVPATRMPQPKKLPHKE